MIRLPVLVEPAIRPHLVAVVCLFAVAGALGWIAPDAATTPILRALRSLVQPLRDLPHGQLFAAILVHNLVASFLTMIAGLLLGILPVLFVLSNGFMIGVVCHVAARTHDAAAIASRILPHGVFELPAMFIAASYGLWLGAGLWARLRGPTSPGVGERLGRATRGYFLIVLPLLVVAAAIESSLPLILKDGWGR